MNRLGYFRLFADILMPKFKILQDNEGTEYVIWENASSFEDLSFIPDKTAFEAQENHIHLVDNIKKEEFETLCNIAQIICNHMLLKLKDSFPSKNFVVYVSVHIRDSMILRFHQVWEDEEEYYSVNDFNTNKERVFRVSG